MRPLEDQAISAFSEALKYISTLEKSLERKSRFSNDLLYNMVTMSFEKLFVSHLAYQGINATHHTPLALYKEANKLTPLPAFMEDTAKLIGKFESICSFDGFGYKTPTSEELEKMILGLISMREYIKQLQISD
jgi:hypothetical protein